MVLEASSQWDEGTRAVYRQPNAAGSHIQEILSAHLVATPEPLTAHRAGVSRPFQQLVMRCMAKEPRDRWQTAEELLPHLEALGTPSGGVPPMAAGSALMWSRVRRKTKITLMAAVLLAVATPLIVERARSDLVSQRAPVQKHGGFDDPRGRERCRQTCGIVGAIGRERAPRKPNKNGRSPP